MQIRLLFLTITFFGLSQTYIYSQIFSPVAISGFNQDVIAEGGPSSLATISFPMTWAGRKSGHPLRNLFCPVYNGKFEPICATIVDIAVKS